MRREKPPGGTPNGKAFAGGLSGRDDGSEKARFCFWFPGKRQKIFCRAKKADAEKEKRRKEKKKSPPFGTVSEGRALCKGVARRQFLRPERGRDCFCAALLKKGAVKASLQSDAPGRICGRAQILPNRCTRFVRCHKLPAGAPDKALRRFRKAFFAFRFSPRPKGRRIFSKVLKIIRPRRKREWYGDRGRRGVPPLCLPQARTPFYK